MHLYYIILLHCTEYKFFIKQIAQGSYKVEQDFCVGFENWGLVRTRLVPARDGKTVLFKGLVRTRLSGKLFGLVRTRHSHKTLNPELFQFAPFC